MTKESKKPKTTAKKSSKTTALAPLDIGLPKSGLVSGKKAMDIVPKGKTLPSSSAKPVIVSNRAVVKDPMAPLELTDVPTEKPIKKRRASAKIVIEPLHENIKPEDDILLDTPDDTLVETEGAYLDTLLDSKGPDEPVDKQAEAANQGAATTKDLPAAKKEEDKKLEEVTEEPEEQKQPEDTSNDTKDENVAIDEAADDIEKSTKPKPEELERKKAEKRAEEAVELIESRKYFLPINSVKKRRSAQFSWLILVLLIVGITILVLLDAGILDFIKAPTDFIN